MEEWLNAFTEELVKQKFSIGTIDIYRVDVRQFLLSCTKPIDLRKITSVDVEKWLANKPSATFNRKRAALSRFFVVMGSLKKVTSNPVDRVKGKPREQRHSEPRSLDIPAYAEAIRRRHTTDMKRERDLALLYLLAECGLGVSEAVNLRVSDIVLHQDRVMVFKNCHIPLSDVAYRALMTLHASRLEYGKDEWLFIKSLRIQKPLTRQGAWKLLHLSAHVAGAPLMPRDLRWHAIRHLLVSITSDAVLATVLSVDLFEIKRYRQKFSNHKAA